PTGALPLSTPQDTLFPLTTLFRSDVGQFSGCSDSSACNYLPEANIPDNSLCLYPGCTDPSACNWQSSAGCDNGTCQYGDHVFNVSIVQSDSPAIITLSLFDEEGGTLISSFSSFIFGSGAHQFCSFDDCPWLEISGISGPNGVITVSSPQYPEFSLNLTTAGYLCPLPGCPDPSACNYLPDANIPDNLLCLYPGCTDPSACNWQFNAGCDNGTCQYGDHVFNLSITQSDSPSIVTLSLFDEEGGTLISSFSTFIFGGGFHQFCTYVECPWVEISGISGPNGVVVVTSPNYPGLSLTLTSEGDLCPLPGCVDPSACNYLPEANIPDNSLCLYPGCTDPSACNWQFNAGCDNGTCQYGDHVFNLSITQSDSPSIVTLSLFEEAGGTLISSFSTFIFGGGFHQFCTYDECPWVEISGISGPNGVVVVTSPNYPGLSLNLTTSGYLCPLPGCPDPSACNYLPDANIPDNSLCLYPGCTDPSACNWQFNAGCDNGTCQFGDHVFNLSITQSDSPSIVTLSLFDEEGGTLISSFSTFIFGGGFHQFCTYVECPWVEISGISGPNGRVDITSPGNFEGTITLVDDGALCLATPCPGDFDTNGVVNTSDLLLLMAAFGCAGACEPYDLDDNGAVNTSDLLLMMAAFGTACP
ncbi:MAG: hypothetical protein JNM00_12185, partial [Flavobacteriales bacterium]|nr:hypothetical protein [Flavobacteriales bacterium]